MLPEERDCFRTPGPRQLDAGLGAPAILCQEDTKAILPLIESNSTFPQGIDAME